MKQLSYDYNKNMFPNEWKQFKICDILELVERPIIMDDEKMYTLVTVKRNYNGVSLRGNFKGKNILVKSQFEIKNGDFIISKRQIAHGACGIVTKDLNNAIVSNEYNLFQCKENFCLEFFYYYCQLPFMKRYFYICSDGVHIEKLLFKTKDFMKKQITIPSYEEQKKINNILVTINRLIELKQKLIAEKEKQKQGLCERLLTEKIRLKNFTSKWQKVKIGSVIKERSEIGYSNLELLAITSANGVIRRNEVDIKDNSSEDKSKYKRILPGDIGYNTMRMWQGICGVSKYEGIVSPAYTILKPTEKVDSYFIEYLFKLPRTVNQFYRHSQGLVKDTLNLKYDNLKKIQVKIPTDIEEQKQIANILTTADKEIDLLKKELNELKDQKKGLMQLLLTGIVRVKCD